jgi:hypothetical protein
MTDKGKQYSEAALNDGHYDDPKADALWYVENCGLLVDTRGNLPVPLRSYKRFRACYRDYCDVDTPSTFDDFKALFVEGLVIWDDVTPPLEDKLHLTLSDVHEWIVATRSQFDDYEGNTYSDEDTDVVIGGTQFNEGVTQEEIDAGMRWVNTALPNLRETLAEFDCIFHDHFGCA